MQYCIASSAHNASALFCYRLVSQCRAALLGSGLTAAALVNKLLRCGAGGVYGFYQRGVIMHMLHLFRFFLAAALAGVGDHIPAARAAVPVVAQGLQRFLGDFTANLTLIFCQAVFQAGGGGFAALHFHILMLVGIGGKVGGQYHAARIGITGHRKADGRVAVAAAGTCGPACKHKALVRHSCDSRSRRTLFDQLADRTGKLAAVCRHKFQRNLGTAYRNGVFGNQVHRRPYRGGDGPQRLRAAIICNISVGTHIIEIFSHSRFGKMHAVRKGVVCLGPAGGIVAQYFGAVQKLIAVLLTHHHQRGVVGVHLGHCQVGVLALLIQRRDRTDDDIAIRPGRFNGFQSLQVGRNERGCIGRRPAQVVGAVANHDALRLQHSHGVRYRIHGGRPAELLALQAGNGPGPHADNADIVGQRRKRLAGLVGIHQVARSVRVANK